ncbi:MAG: phenylalanine--tRNA ligase subunit alpha [Novibacillus thermophilus]|jgi:phenylalanyl-tRNA synthetase alpha chain|uniref:Phenylalanine--tRNA ligase alpha subunit n=1 Tax=Novibacillus thermophilus TaxID=1471761 RepID=A0A1U9K4G6_9BACL|nr:phenylalanine--tRNA ligase subunit alpha [Novibacillus thermophilus]AQS54910.1 phenylalanine--tRNA ligase subunit alpha [Novibacillus thermophilus]
MKEQLTALRARAMEAVRQAETEQELSETRVAYLGKKGELTQFLRQMGQLAPKERPAVGKLVNSIRRELEEAVSRKEKELKEQALAEQLARESVDVTLPGRTFDQGSIHPLSSIVEQIEDIFIGMGFQVADGPLVEWDYYNFEAMNMPKNHPARDMQDTFYITEDILMRTHTSPVQARTMESRKGKPVKVICPGFAFRRDDDDATHSHQFSQTEGLVIDKNIAMSDLKGTLTEFAHRMYGEDRRVRFRASYFPFVEPGAEMDVSCANCGGDGCHVCKKTGWIEILGAGMVHPRVLEMSGYDPEKYTGFAFGMGIERVAMLKYGVDDIRYYFNNDLRFLRQFVSL